MSDRGTAASGAHDIETIPLASPLYPVSLKTIKNPPPILYARGNLDLLQMLPGVSVVGSREATRNGLIITQRLTEYIVEHNKIIVSGLALGIDAMAHQACINAGGKTIAVLAHGLRTPSPKANEKLAYQILESGGLWVSEHAPEVALHRQYFVPRNRIQVGLSRISIVVEAGISSGTTTHAKFCTEAHHALYAVMPQAGNPLKLNCAGSQMMVEKMGAIALTSRDDYSRLTL